MIYTVTLNPALDYIMHVPNMETGTTNRSQSEQIYPGGKGINVSMMLSNLGVENIALGFKAGFTGEELERRLNETKCKSNLTKTKGLTRINVKIKSSEETEINGSGPHIEAGHLDELMERLALLQSGDYLVLSGRVQSAISQDIYEKILKKIEGKIIHTVVDTSGQLLRRALKYNPFLIKPNRKELVELFDKGANPEKINEAELIKYAEELRKEGGRNVMISLGSQGALFICECGEVYRLTAPKGELINSVGSGDAMVAGFIANYLETFNLKKAFKLGVAAGSASAFNRWLADKEDVQKTYDQIEEVITIKD